MQATSRNFKKNVHAAINDATLQRAMTKLGFQAARAAAVSRLPEFDKLRDQARDIKNHVLENLDLYLERYEAEMTRRGGQLHWCRTADEARAAVLEICRRLDAKIVTKGKSMVGEEIGINEFLEANGIAPVETDLGEYIIQLRHEPPSHIIAPAVHLTKDQVADAFLENHRQYGKTRRLEEAADLLAEAREILREKFIAADVGITGANFLIAETGSSVIVTNEGNGDLTQNLTKAHIVLATPEKLVPTLEDATTILRLLARSATGQEMSVYTTFSTGPRRGEDLDGPGEYHVILVDNGRTALLGTEFQDILRCIRCAACINHCPVYNTIGGHAYGWVYPGPIGSVLTPALIGIDEAGDLPNASTLCGRCESVCPMRIPLPKMLRHWREKEYEKGLAPKPFRTGLKLWAWFAKRPRLYHLGSRMAMKLLGILGRGRGSFRHLPLARGWTGGRDMPAPEGPTFQSLWAAERKSGRT
ncbi:MAG TPA: LutB/LldF family L-lactate oxidation iron-sulfur protein [Alphaproteobacteria bacterium]|nr:LutB/LldF family L-lactate oxidation iron-sulfur protein [Alphaproteobacteria bacterium]